MVSSGLPALRQVRDKRVAVIVPRPEMPCCLILRAQTVLKLVAGLVGSVGCGFPNGNTYHSGRVSPNFSRYHLECSYQRRQHIRLERDRSSLPGVCLAVSHGQRCL